MVATLSHSSKFRVTLEAAHRITWRVEDIIGGDKKLDFSRPFLPEALAGVQAIACLSASEKLLLNQIRGNSYLHLFGVVEEAIVPLLLDHIKAIGTDDIVATQAFFCFAEEEGKHIQLFRRFSEEFAAGFGTPCRCIGPAKDLAAAILAHRPLGVALAVLHIEWMTQRHYLESVHDDQDLDPQFKSLLRHHWLEEAQHARLDALMVEAMATTLDETGIAQGIADYLAIGRFLDGGLAAQVELDIESLETASRRRFSDTEKQAIREAQQRAYRWTFLGSGMSHPNFLASLKALSASAAEEVEALALTMQ